MSLSKHIFVSLFIFALVLYNFNPLLTNVTTPGGDGSRIFPYMQFIDNADTFFPLWNPYKCGGMPTLADPERFVWAAKLIDTDSPYANLQMNILMLMLIGILGITLYYLAKALSISSEAALMPVFVFLFSWFCSRWVYCGRITSILFMIGVNISTWLLIRYYHKKDPILWGLAVLITGWCDSYTGYYGVVTILPVHGAVTWLTMREQKKGIESIYKTLFYLFCVHGIGILMMSVFLVPLFYYLSSDLKNIPPLFFLSHKLPRPDTFMHFFFPYSHKFPQEVFPFVSLICFPLTVMLFANQRRITTKGPWVFLILALGPFCILMGKIPPFSYIVYFIEHMVLLRHIRQPETFTYLLTFSLAILSGYSYDTIFRQHAKRLKDFFIPLLVFLLLGGIALGLNYYEYTKINGHDKLLFFFQENCLKWIDLLKNTPILILVIGLFIFPYTAICSHKTVRLYILGLAVFQLIFFKVMINVAPTKNKNTLGPVAQVLKADNDYYRIWGKRDWWTINAIGLPNEISLNGFSMYFSDAHRKMLGLLLNKDIDVLRPHWVKGLDHFQMNILKLLNVKYVFSRSNRFVKPNEIENGLKAIDLKPQGQYRLYLNKNWACALRMFDQWEVVSHAEAILSKMTAHDFDPFAKLYLQKDPGLPAPKNERLLESRVDILYYTTDKIMLKIHTNKAGMLFIPEYYDNGWQAFLDGKKCDIIKADIAFRSIPVKAGTHLLCLKYSPFVLWFGLLITMLTLGVVLVVIIRQKALPK